MYNQFHSRPFKPLRYHRVIRGFTLLELLLVLTILVIIGSLAVPALDRMMERQRLRSAADEMRLVWDGARIAAMRTGQAQVFQCTVGSNSYTIEPLVLHDDVNNIGEGATILNGGVAVEATSSNYGMTTTAAKTTEAEKQLDESLKFLSCAVASDLRAFSLAQSGQTAAVNIESVNQSVIFYPDGTTSTAEMRVQNERGETVGVQIRGLTGHTRILAFQGVEEAAP